MLVGTNVVNCLVKEIFQTLSLRMASKASSKLKVDRRVQCLGTDIVVVAVVVAVVVVVVVAVNMFYSDFLHLASYILYIHVQVNKFKSITKLI